MKSTKKIVLTLVIMSLLIVLWIAFDKYSNTKSEYTSTDKSPIDAPTTVLETEKNRSPELFLDVKTSQSDAAIQPEDLGFVAGRVLDESGQPALGARVTWSAGSQFCESDGYFSISTRVGQVLKITIDCDDDVRLKEGLPSLIGQQVSGLRAQKKSDPIHEFFLVSGSRIDGIVVDPEGRPVAGAIIYCGEARSDVQGGFVFVVNVSTPEEIHAWPEAETREDGTFVLSGMPKPDFRIWAEDEDFSRSLSVNLQSGSREVVLALRPICELRGRVIDSTGKPVETVIDLLIEGTEVANDNSEWVLMDRSDGESKPGEFFLRSTIPGSHQVWIDDVRFAPLEKNQVRLKPGENDPIDVVLHRPTEWVGRALSPTGDPVAGARWLPVENSSNTTSQWMLRPVLTDSEGLFSLRLPPLELGMPETLRLVHPGYMDFILETGNRGIGFYDLGDIYLAEGWTLRGKVLNPEGFGLESATVEVRSVSDPTHETNASIELMTESLGEFETLLEEEGFEDSVQTDANGNFVVSLDKPREIEIQGRSPGYAPSEIQVLQVQESVSGIILELSEAWQVAGQVVDLSGRGVGGVRLGATSIDEEFVELSLSALFGVGENEQETLQTVSDPEGFFSFEVPEDALWEIRVKPGQDWVGIEPCRARVGEREAKLAVIEGGRIEGTVIDAITRQPITKFRLSRSDQKPQGSFIFGSGTSTVEISDADGYFELTGLSEKEIAVSISRSGYVPWQEQFQMAPGVTEEIMVLLIPGATLTGTILDANGEPLSGAHVLVYRPEEEIPESEVGGTGVIQISFGDGGSFSLGLAHPRTNQQGRYEIDELAAGDWMVTIRHKDHSDRTLRVTGVLPALTTTVTTQILDHLSPPAEN